MLILSLLSAFSFYEHKNPSVQANVKVFKNTEYLGMYGNVITDIGENYVRDVLGFNNVTSYNATKYLANGNATAGSALTKLTSESTINGFERMLGTVTALEQSGDRSYNVTGTWTCTAGAGKNQTINCLALQTSPDSDSDGNLFAVVNIAQTIFVNGDTCTAIWIIIVDAN